MKTSARIVIFCALSCILGQQALNAQTSAELTPYESDILAARPVRFVFGLGLGTYFYSHGGSFSPSCDCEFGDESGFRPMFLGELRIQYPKLNIAYGVSVSYYDASAEFSREETRSSVVVGDNPDLDVNYRNSSEVALRWLAITPEFFWYLPRSDFFFQAGVEFGFPMESRYNHVEAILTEGVTYYDGGTEHTLLEEQEIPGGRRMRIAASGSVGYDFWLAPAIALTPRAGLSIPLTSVSDVDNSWRILTGYAIIMLILRI